jgi:transcriptional regulator with XRE-family HTH domain
MELEHHSAEAYQAIAGEVRAWLARRQLSGRSVAQQLGMTEIYLNRRLRGAVPFNVVDLTAIARLLDVPVTVFFDVPEGARTIMRVRTTPSRAPILAAAA